MKKARLRALTLFYNFLFVLTSEVEMKKARLRALTQTHCLNQLRSQPCRNEESTTEGIDTRRNM